MISQLVLSTDPVQPLEAGEAPTECILPAVHPEEDRHYSKPVIGITVLSLRLSHDNARPAGGSSLSASAGVGSSQKGSLRLSRGSSIYPYKVVGQHNLTWRLPPSCPGGGLTHG